MSSVIAASSRGRDRLPADDAARGTRQEQPHRAQRGGFRSRHAAARMDDREAAAEPRLAQPCIGAREVARQHRLDIGVEGGNSRALVLAELRIDHRGERQRDPGMARPDQRRCAFLVHGVDEREQEGDGDRLRALGHECVDRAHQPRLVERRHHAAIGADALADADAPTRRRQEHRRVG